MRLTWTAEDRTSFTAEGRERSYSVRWDGHTWHVLQMRQPGGQVTNRNACINQDGAFARAQTWETQSEDDHQSAEAMRMQREAEMYGS